MAFDPKKPYGTVHGTSDGRAFEQNGVFYTSDGSAWVDPAGGPNNPDPEPKSPGSGLEPSIPSPSPKKGPAAKP